MGVFSDFKMSWDGVDYSIPKDRILGAIDAVEDVVTISQIHTMLADPEKIRFRKVARAFGELLRYAGAKISDEAIYEGMFSQDKDKTSSVMVSLFLLLKLMIPESAMKAPEAPASGNPNRQARRAAASLSSKPSKPRAVRKS
ncbi:MAG: hypothetical protein K2Y29_07985 [Beijerinckiaceae bacterium]|nr:hypothetical protein [Beijerinckiaceae bacterium]